MARRDVHLTVIGDLHCGSPAGLTPPTWCADNTTLPNAKKRRLADERKKLWRWVMATKKKYPRPDYLSVGGDCVDMCGGKEGGAELLYPDPDDQVDMAAEVIKNFAPKKEIIMVRGSKFHTYSGGYDMERGLAKQLGCDIQGHLHARINGVLFDVKHKIGASGVPHGRSNALMKTRLWDQQWFFEGNKPVSDVYIRHHVHYHQGVFGVTGGKRWVGMTCPALQALGSDFGVLNCEGVVHFGMVFFKIDKKGRVTWQAEIAPGEYQAAKILELS